MVRNVAGLCTFDDFLGKSTGASRNGGFGIYQNFLSAVLPDCARALIYEFVTRPLSPFTLTEQQLHSPLPLQVSTSFFGEFLHHKHPLHFHGQLFTCMDRWIVLLVLWLLYQRDAQSFSAHSRNARSSCRARNVPLKPALFLVHIFNTHRRCKCHFLYIAKWRRKS